jgi:hypothetical protein
MRCIGIRLDRFFRRRCIIGVSPLQAAHHPRFTGDGFTVFT